MRHMRLLGPLAVMLVVGCGSTAPASPGPTAVAGLPTVAIDSPATGTIIAVGQLLQVNVRGQDAGGVSRLDLRVGDVLVDNASTPSNVPQPLFAATLEWTPSAEGTVSVSALAFRPDGTGSPPVSISITVVSSTGVISPVPTSPASFPPGATFPPAPTFAPTPTIPPQATVPPTRAPRPTRPPAPTMAPRPTPTPSPTPIAADLEVTQVDVPPVWTVGVEVPVSVYIRNNHPTDSAPPNSIIELFVAGHTVTMDISSKPIGPLGIEHYTLFVTPQRDGARTLRATIILPPGYGDTTPDNNVFRMDIVVAPAAPATP